MYEPPVEVNKPQEDLDLMVGLCIWPFLDGGNLALIHGHPVGGYHESQGFDFGGEEITLLQTRVQSKLL